ncbi:hypothetical protein AC579_1898 [Pseudocercospora musae]|uniref:Uncharacterized protein n=1 Tax=Pseudocercospora musae TaxID=113226 RepID=A0A139I2A4_9PEZI|nr:hypothetical protein AC579_1898 [Pseudocercospora musae]
MAWLSNNLAPHYVRATGTGFQIMTANLAAFVATLTYIDKEYTVGHAMTIAAAMGCIIIPLSYNVSRKPVAIANSAYSSIQRIENRKRSNGTRDHRLQEESEDRLGSSRHTNFRLTLYKK